MRIMYAQRTGMDRPIPPHHVTNSDPAGEGLCRDAAAVVLVRYVGRAMTRQLLQSGPFAIQKGQHQQPAEDESVPVAKAGTQHPQVLGDAARQTGEGHGPGLLGPTRPVRR
jgi:hypothetical protein